MPMHTSLKSLKLYYGKGSYSASYYKIYIFYKMQKKGAVSMQFSENRGGYV